MQWRSFLSGAVAAAWAASVPLPVPAADPKPPIRAIDHACLPVGPPKRNVPVYRSDVRQPYIAVALIESFSAHEPTECDERAMLIDIQAKAGSIGADAVVKVRRLKVRQRGLVENPRTPFYSLQQGEHVEEFLRATAIVYSPRGTGGRKYGSSKPQPAAPASAPSGGIGIDAGIIPDIRGAAPQ